MERASARGRTIFTFEGGLDILVDSRPVAPGTRVWDRLPGKSMPANPFWVKFSDVGDFLNHSHFAEHLPLDRLLVRLRWGEETAFEFNRGQWSPMLAMWQFAAAAPGLRSSQ